MDGVIKQSLAAKTVFNAVGYPEKRNFCLQSKKKSFKAKGQQPKHKQTKGNKTVDEAVG